MRSISRYFSKKFFGNSSWDASKNIPVISSDVPLRTNSWKVLEIFTGILQKFLVGLFLKFLQWLVQKFLQRHLKVFRDFFRNISRGFLQRFSMKIFEKLYKFSLKILQWLLREFLVFFRYSRRNSYVKYIEK